MKTILVATLVVVGLVSGGGAANAGDGGACVRLPGAMLAYARPDEPKQAPKTGNPIREAVSVQPKLHVPTLRQPAVSEQPARDDANGPLRIGSRMEGKPDTHMPGQIAMSEHPIACETR